jgi:DNA-binding Lrp family transcriptional regulator
MEELEILEFHHVTGDEDVVLKMKTKNIDTLEANLMKITQLEGVLRTRTMICLSSVEGLYETAIIDSTEGPPPKDILWNFT